MELSLVRLVGAELATLAEVLGAPLAEPVASGASLGAAVAVHLPDLADAIATGARQAIAQAWARTGMPRELLSQEVAGLPDLVIAHRPSADMLLGALAAVRAADSHGAGARASALQAGRIAAAIVERSGLAESPAGSGRVRIAFFVIEATYHALLMCHDRILAGRAGLIEAVAAAVRDVAGDAPAAPVAGAAASAAGQAPEAAELPLADVAGDGEAGDALRRALRMPLAKVFAGEDRLSVEIAARAAQAHDVIRRLSAVGDGEPFVARLRGEAASELAGGRIVKADGLLGQAEDLDVQAAQTDFEGARRRLASAAMTRSARGEIEEIRADYRKAARHYRAAARLLARDDHLPRWRLYMREGLSRITEAQVYGTGAVLTDAGEAFAAAADQLEPAAHPTEWSTAQLSVVGVSLAIAEREHRPDMLHDAVARARSAASLLVHHGVMPEGVRAQIVLGHALRRLGEDTRDAVRLSEAAGVFRGAIGLARRDREPELWAEAQASAGMTLARLAEWSGVPGARDDAVQHLRAALADAGDPARGDDRARWRVTLASAILAQAETSGDFRLAAEAAEEFTTATGDAAAAGRLAMQVEAEVGLADALGLIAVATREPGAIAAAVHQHHRAVAACEAAGQALRAATLAGALARLEAAVAHPGSGGGDASDLYGAQRLAV